jgi:hypothetical protein
MANFPLPKGYQRMGAFPLDGTSVFATLAELEAYALTAVAYTGQICSVGEQAYIIKADKSVTQVGGGVNDLDYGEF